MSNIYAMADTWTGGLAYTAILMNVTDTSSTAGSLLMDLQVAAASKFKVGKDGSITLNAFASLFGDAANVLAFRNGTSAQTFNLYNTYTDASNYERLAIYFTANTATIQPQGAGTGNARTLVIDIPLGGSSFNYRTGATDRWIFLSSNGGNHFVAGADNAYDIGAVGTRPRSVYAGTSFIGPGGATLMTTSAALTNGAGVATGTLTTAPSAGNPTKWIGINDNGTTRYVPAW